MHARELPEVPLKSSFSRKMWGLSIFFLLLIFIVSMMPTSFGEALQSGGGRIVAHGSGPGTMILLGGVLIGVAGWGSKEVKQGGQAI
jgi:hypothetical protein